MKNIIKNAIANSFSYSGFQDLVQKLTDEGSSTGIPNEEKITFTKINLQRMSRLDRKLNLQPEEAQIFKNINTLQTWLVILESWCGDGAQTIPVLNKIAEVSGKIDLRIVIRDENEALMDQFLTNGSRSIPKLIILDEDLQILETWGPRSAAATKLVEAYKAEHGRIDSTFKTELQVWYNKDKGRHMIDELMQIEEQLENNPSPLLT